MERVSFPPNPPPMRLVLDTSLCWGRPRTLATYLWCLPGAWGVWVCRCGV
jgi:hypothetical protein